MKKQYQYFIMSENDIVLMEGYLLAETSTDVSRKMKEKYVHEFPNCKVTVFPKIYKLENKNNEE